MTTDLTIALSHRPGTLAAASGVLGGAGINIEGQCAYVCGGRGVYHLLVEDAVSAYRALIDAGFEVLAERRVVVIRVENRPGATASVLRHAAERGVDIDLAYVAADGRLVLGSPDPEALARAVSPEGHPAAD